MSTKNQTSIEDHDELEYNITFPVHEELQSDEYKEPVVYLLGWTGATDKVLAKYSAIYEKEGFITLRYISPSNLLFLKAPADTLKDTSQKLLQLLEDYDLRDHPVFFHVFSNGGTMLYHFATEAFQNDKIDVIGVIMDSAPSRLRVIAGIKAVYYTNRPKGLIYSTMACCGFSAIALMRGIFGRENINMDGYQALKVSKLSTYPHLFLYSTIDALVPWQCIEEFADARKEAGAIVRTVNFIDSQHVGHMRSYTKRYTELTLKFLDSCLGIYDGTYDKSDPLNLSSSVDPPEYDR